MGARKTNTGEPEKNNITQGSIFGQLLLFFFPILFSYLFLIFLNIDFLCFLYIKGQD